MLRFLFFQRFSRRILADMFGYRVPIGKAVVSKHVDEVLLHFDHARLLHAEEGHDGQSYRQDHSH